MFFAKIGSLRSFALASILVLGLTGEAVSAPKAKPKKGAAPARTVARATAKKSSAAARTPAAAPARAPAFTREPAMSTGGESEKVLKVQGQTRNLSMMLTIKGEKDKIKFGEIRENYKDLVPKTNY